MYIHEPYSFLSKYVSFKYNLFNSITLIIKSINFLPNEPVTNYSWTFLFWFEVTKIFRPKKLLVRNDQTCLILGSVYFSVLRRSRLSAEWLKINLCSTLTPAAAASSAESAQTSNNSILLFLLTNIFKFIQILVTFKNYIPFGGSGGRKNLISWAKIFFWLSSHAATIWLKMAAALMKKTSK